MKNTKLTTWIIAAGLLALSISPTSAMYRIYDTANDFLDAQAGSCISATDGTQTYDIIDGQISGYTGSYTTNTGINWQCVDFQEGVMTLMMTKSLPVEGAISGTITEVEQGKDGKQVTFVSTTGEIYSTAVSVMSDTIVGGKSEDLVEGIKVKVTYDDISGNILIGNKIELVSYFDDIIYLADDVPGITGHELSSADQLLYTSILEVIQPEYQEKISQTLLKIENISKNYSQTQKNIFARKINRAVDTELAKIEAKTTQTPKEKQIFLALSMLKIELKMTLWN